MNNHDIRWKEGSMTALAGVKTRPSMHACRHVLGSQSMSTSMENTEGRNQQSQISASCFVTINSQFTDRVTETFLSCMHEQLVGSNLEPNFPAMKARQSWDKNNTYIESTFCMKLGCVIIRRAHIAPCASTKERTKRKLLIRRRRRRQSQTSHQ